MCNIWGWKFSTSAYRSWSISGTHVMAWLPCCCCVATWLCGHAWQTSFLYFFCTLKGNYVWRFHEVHTTIAPCLSTALTICLCVRSIQVWLFLQGLKVIRLGFYGIYPILHLCIGTQPRQSWETDCYMPGADQSGWWFGPEIGGEKASRWFPSSTPDHIYCLPSASCWKNFPTIMFFVK